MEELWAEPLKKFILNYKDALECAFYSKWEENMYAKIFFFNKLFKENNEDLCSKLTNEFHIELSDKFNLGWIVFVCNNELEEEEDKEEQSFIENAWRLHCIWVLKFNYWKFIYKFKIKTHTIFIF